MRKLLSVVLLLSAICSSQVLSPQTKAAQDAVTALSTVAESNISTLTTQNATLTGANSFLTQQTQALTTQLTTAQQNLSAAQTQIATLSTLARYRTDLQKSLDWSTGTIGTAIGGANPCATCYKRTWDSDLNLILSLTGTPGQYNDWLTALHFDNAITTNTKYIDVQYTFNVLTDRANTQAEEFDSLSVINGMMYNGSTQIEYSSGGKFQFASGKGWIDAGLPAFGRLSVGTHSIRWQYTLDQTAKTIQFISVTFDGKRYPINVNPGVQLATASTWGTGRFHIQLQQDSNPRGGDIKTMFTGIKYNIYDAN